MKIIGYSIIIKNENPFLAVCEGIWKTKEEATEVAKRLIHPGDKYQIAKVTITASDKYKQNKVKK
jgi:hypothetical protein